MTIAVVDTTVLCNLLDVPGRAQDRGQAVSELQGFLREGVTLLLPMVVILETGNHIGQVANGRGRRRAAEVFVDQVEKALSGEAPWTPTPTPDAEEVRDWIGRFPEEAMRGLGFGDLSIIQVFEQNCRRHRHRRVFIWAYDQHLQGYDRKP
ncbi:MAG: hypothetical protein AAGN66_07940 [Acidobacteriota bacterium]